MGRARASKRPSRNRAGKARRGSQNQQRRASVDRSKCQGGEKEKAAGGGTPKAAETKTVKATPTSPIPLPATAASPKKRDPEKAISTEKTKECPTATDDSRHEDDELSHISSANSWSVADPTKDKDNRSDIEAAQLSWMKAVLERGVDGVKEEYKGLTSNETPQPATAFEANPSKNRYSNMKCWDESRVVVKKIDGEYIHASYIADKDLILTQGPLKTSVSDFWQMVWQEKSCVIAMLCSLQEDGKTKCEEYWKDEEGASIEHGPFKITTRSVKKGTGLPDGEDLFVSELSLVKDGKTDKTRQLVHYRYASWPDHSVPASFSIIPGLLLKLQIAHKRQTSANNFSGCISPLVIHCSAGVGRSGTMAAIYLVGKALRTATRPVSVAKHIRQLRKDRACAVQNVNQYAFVHVVLLHDLLAANIHNPPDIASFTNDFLKALPPPKSTKE